LAVSEELEEDSRVEALAAFSRWSAWWRQSRAKATATKEKGDGLGEMLGL
jgi:hypothetical protein